jgi:hypothetical protein
MRKIKSHFFISLDGVVESPDKWHFPYFDDEMGEAVSAGFATTDALLMGRQRHHRPLVAARGPCRRAPPDEPTIPLELASSQTFKTGVLNLSYTPANN